MLRFIRRPREGEILLVIFQYISCYGLSACSEWLWIYAPNFNTSHVTVYPSGRRKPTGNNGISIHLMLRFIQEIIAGKLDLSAFQYISCYGLSPIRIAVPLINFDFNTSHVTVYHKRSKVFPCLFTISIHLMLRFITVSQRPRYPYRSYFNTSHVTVYLYAHPRAVPEWNFNTSHVTVYLPKSTINNIENGYFNTSHVTVYQSPSFRLLSHLRISIHLMLRFIERFGFCLEAVCLISIHLMLRFIMREHPVASANDLDFNTSHVTVYRRRVHAACAGWRFQYISCYGLSPSLFVKIE